MAMRFLGIMSLLGALATASCDRPVTLQLGGGTDQISSLDPLMSPEKRALARAHPEMYGDDPLISR